MSAVTAAAIFAAVTAILTAFVRVPVPPGFVHLGDAVIFLASALLPAPLAAAAAATGGGFADLIAGYPLYIPATVLIKAAMTIPFGKASRIITGRNILACVFAVLIGAGGYLAYDFLLYGDGALMALPANIFQEIASGIIFIIIGGIIDKSGVKKYFRF